MAADSRNGDVQIECRDLRKDFEVRGRRVRVLEGVELSGRRGEIVVITGRTGSGKSTLLGLLGGLDRPTAGMVMLDGRRVDDLPGAEWAALRRRRIGYLFQHFNLLPAWTAAENVEAAMLHTDVTRSARRKKARTLLEALGLGDRLEHLPSELSVGQQQLVAVARTLVNEPSLLLADEPTGDVDPEMADEIVGQLTAHVRTRGATLVLATHGTFPLERADRALVLAEGGLSPMESAT